MYFWNINALTKELKEKKVLPKDEFLYFLCNIAIIVLAINFI